MFRVSLTREMPYVRANRQTNGAIAHSACLGFGLERVTMALFKAHGFDPVTWPSVVRAQLWP